MLLAKRLFASVFFAIALSASATYGQIIGVDCNTLPPTIEFYVDPVNGSDTGFAWHQRVGRLDRPYRSIHAARDAVRGWKAACALDRPATVWLRGGTYEFAPLGELVFTPQDSGDLDAATPIYITYAAYEQGGVREEVLVTGGQTVDSATIGYGDPILSSTGQSVRWWGTYAVDWLVSDIWINNRRMTLAREPDVHDNLATTSGGRGWLFLQTLTVDPSGDRILGFSPMPLLDQGLPLHTAGDPTSLDEGAAEIVGMRQSVSFRQWPEQFLGDDTSPVVGERVRFDQLHPLGTVCGSQPVPYFVISALSNDLTALDPDDDWWNVEYPDLYTCPGCPTYVSHGDLPSSSDRVFAEGAKGFIDSPYEWYQRKWITQEPAHHQLNVTLPEEMSLRSDVAGTPATMVVPGEDMRTLVRFEGGRAASGVVVEPVEGIRFQGIAFAHTNFARTLADDPRYATTLVTRGIQRLGPCHGWVMHSWPGAPYPTEDVNILPAAIEASGVSGIQFVECQIAHTAANGINLFTDTYCEDEYPLGVRKITIQGCSFFDIGGTAVFAAPFDEDFGSQVNRDLWVTECGSQHVSSPTGVDILDNWFFDIGKRFYTSAAIITGRSKDIFIKRNRIDETANAGIAVGTIARSNLDSSGSYMVFPGANTECDALEYISVRGSIVIEANHISRTMRDTADLAAIYVVSSPGGDWYLPPGAGYPDCVGWTGPPTGPGQRDVAMIVGNVIEDVYSPVSDNLMASPAHPTSNPCPPDESNAVAGIYLDNCASNWTLADNVLKDCHHYFFTQSSSTVAGAGALAYPKSFCWGTNYYDDSIYGSSLDWFRRYQQCQLNWSAAAWADIDNWLPASKLQHTGAAPAAVASIEAAAGPDLVQYPDVGNPSSLTWEFGFPY